MNVKSLLNILAVCFLYFFSALLSPAMSICLGQISAEYTAWATKQCTSSGYETPVRVTSQDPSIAVVSRTIDGPWVADFTFPVLLVLEDDGFCRWQPLDGNGVRWWYKGVTPGSTTLTQGTYIGWKDFDVTYADCSPPEITSIQELPVDENLVPSPVEPNPSSAGGGIRIYPGDDYPGETADRAIIKLQVGTNKPNRIVYFKSFDPDDPSSDDTQVDFNLDGSDDNRGVPNVGELEASSATTDADGIAEVNFTVTKHPGDNFIVAASFDPDVLDTFTTIGTQVVNSEGTPLPVDGAFATKLITVWRKLHIEIDRMDLVNGNYIKGSVKSISYNKKKNETTITLEVPYALDTNRFALGNVVLITGEGSAEKKNRYLVENNKRRTVTVFGSIPETVGKGKNPAVVRYELYDDDDYNRDDGDIRDGDEGEEILPLSNTFALLRTSDDQNENILAQAYITPIYDGGGDPTSNEVIPFTLNVISDPEAEWYINPNWDDTNKKYRQSHLNESDDFWVSYFLLAYQGDKNEDFDPDPGDSAVINVGLAGVTPGEVMDFSDFVSINEEPRRGSEGTILFLETITDIQANNYTSMSPEFDKKAAAHELGHQLGLAGDMPCVDCGVMSYGDKPLDFVPQHLNIIRNRIKSPGQMY